MFSILKLTSIYIFQYNSAVHLQFQIFTKVSVEDIKKTHSKSLHAN